MLLVPSYEVRRILELEEIVVLIQSYSNDKSMIAICLDVANYQLQVRHHLNRIRASR